jgi:hypothetical protein
MRNLNHIETMKPGAATPLNESRYRPQARRLPVPLMNHHHHVHDHELPNPPPPASPIWTTST